jgi:hypothetical protein
MTLLSRGEGGISDDVLQVGQWCEQKESPDDPPEKKSPIGSIRSGIRWETPKETAGPGGRRGTSVSRW